MEALVKNYFVVIVIVLMIIAAIILGHRKVEAPSPATEAPSTQTTTTPQTRYITISNINYDSSTKQLAVAGMGKMVYFEAIIGAQVLDQQNQVVWTGFGQAQSDWMTDQPVPYTVNADLTNLVPGTYTLTLTESTGADPAELGRSLVTMSQQFVVN